MSEPTRAELLEQVLQEARNTLLRMKTLRSLYKTIDFDGMLGGEIASLQRLVTLVDETEKP